MMEQKKIDQIDESFFGEAILDEEVVMGKKKVAKLKKVSEERTDKEVEKKVSKRKISTSKAASKRKSTKASTSLKKAEKNTGPEVSSKETVKIEPVVVSGKKEDSIRIEPATKTGTSAGSMKQAEPAKKEKSLSLKSEGEKSQSKSHSSTQDSDGDEEEGLFSSTGVWKLIAGVAVVLLLFSLFSGGGFSGSGEAGEISLREAEELGIAFVNSELLVAPFSAELVDSKREGDLYRLTFSFADEEIDSYMTKDGEFFFPQGFELEEGLLAGGEDETVGTDEEVFDVGDPNAVSIDDDPMLGNIDAPITIVEFSDFQCSFCKSATSTVKEIEDKYVASGDVKIVYRDFPLENIHPQAKPAAMAAECAHEQGESFFWEYHDLLFEQQSELSAENYLLWAEEIGLDSGAFVECVEDERYAQEVEADFAAGQALGVSGTPAFFINGKMFEGAQPYSVFEAEIEGILAALAAEEQAELDPVEDDSDSLTEADDEVMGIGDESIEEIVTEEEEVIEEISAAPSVSLEMEAKRWLFSPRVLSVEQGSEVMLTIVPEDLDFTFAIPGLGIEEEVSGETVVHFIADSAGEFAFTCSSCEEWRGMSGTLVVS